MGPSGSWSKFSDDARRVDVDAAGRLLVSTSRGCSIYSELDRAPRSILTPSTLPGARFISAANGQLYAVWTEYSPRRRGRVRRLAGSRWVADDSALVQSLVAGASTDNATVLVGDEGIVRRSVDKPSARWTKASLPALGTARPAGMRGPWTRFGLHSAARGAGALWAAGFEAPNLPLLLCSTDHGARWTRHTLPVDELASIDGIAGWPDGITVSVTFGSGAHGMLTSSDGVTFERFDQDIGGRWLVAHDDGSITCLDEDNQVRRAKLGLAPRRDSFERLAIVDGRPAVSVARWRGRWWAVVEYTHCAEDEDDEDEFEREGLYVSEQIESRC
ncbi:MAG: hypothetical protein JNK05_10200 [Myxococcales bacterium]|nr:hypothetical protein [Myxococcales bacterium]